MRYQRIRARAALACFCVFGWMATPSFGQNAVSGTVIGTVLDTTGAAVPGAAVRVENIAQGVVYNTTTNDSGNYTQTNVQPGNYTITITKTGFQKYVQQNVAVAVSQSTRVDASLQVGAETQEVTVTAAPPAIETDRADVQTNLTAGQIGSLPVANRNFTNLALLTPGSVINTYQHAASENPQQSTLVNTGGQLFANTNYQLDGMNNNDVVLGITMVNPPIDSVAEFTAETSNYDAEYHATGAVISVETKSGTNDFHGSAFEFLQNDLFQARDPFTQGLHAPGTPTPPHRGIPELRWNQFGGTVGGPIKKDRLFFFGDYQATYRRNGASESLRVPTAAERTGNLSDLGVTIYNPFTGNPDGTGRAVFTGAMIPPNLIPQPISKLLSVLPQPNFTPVSATANNYSASTVENYNTNQFDIRSDYFSSSNKLHAFGRYDYLTADINAPGPFGLYGGPQFPQLGFSGLSNALNQNASGDVTYTFGPTLLTDVRIGMSRYRVTVTAPDQTTQLANSVGIPGLNIDGRPDTNGLPDLQLSGALFMGYSCNCPLHERETVIDYVNNWTKIAGNHTIRFGSTWEQAWNQRLPSDNHRAGVYNFTGSVTSSAANTNSGDPLASFLLGLPSTFARFQQQSTTQEDRQNRSYSFVQDTWRITSKLTLNLGVRWDIWFPDYSLHAGQGGRYDVTTNIVYIPGVGGVSLNANQNTQWFNFSPRVGIAYAPDSKTVVRTGYGRGYSQGTFGWTFNNLAADIFPSIVNQNITQTSPFVAVFPITTAPPAVVFPTIPSNGQLPLPTGISTPYIPANQKIPYSEQWNFTVQRELVSQLTVSLGYVGNVGRHLNGGFALNDAPPGPGPLLTRRPLYLRYGLPQPINDKCDCTSSNYNAFQVQASKRFGGFYSLLANFSWQRALDYAQESVPLPT
ncbi:MAG: TonB-dependent receptor, partial [Acidobacteriaceae bacterium]|nr:TonB-dependent receptor [Acidobacteriaceae bacterium]